MECNCLSEFGMSIVYLIQFIFYICLWEFWKYMVKKLLKKKEEKQR